MTSNITSGLCGNPKLSVFDQYLKNCNTYGQTHIIKINRHDPRNLHKPEVTSKPIPVCVATLICVFLRQYLENGMSYVQSHKIILKWHDLRSLYKLDVISDTTSGLCDNTKTFVLGQNKRVVGPTAQRHNLSMNRYDPSNSYKPEVTSRSLPVWVATLICQF